jgi:hypothetical protein
MSRRLLLPIGLAALLSLFSPPAAAQRGPSEAWCSPVRPAPHRGYGDSRAYVPSRVWIPGRYEYELQRVWVPGRSERIWVEPVFQLRYDGCGNLLRVLLSPGHWSTVHHPGHYETRRVRVWVPGHWQARGVWR